MPPAAFPSGRKSLLLLLVLAAAIIGSAWWRQRPPPDPEYNGQRLSDWLADTAKSGNWSPSAEQLRAFGPAAVPWLTYTVEHGRHEYIKDGPLPLDNAPHWLRRLLPQKWGGFRESWTGDERVEAVAALQQLGPEAAPAIPALVRSLESEDWHLRATAAAALHRIGPASWPAVEDVFNHATFGRQYLLMNMYFRLDIQTSDAEIEHAVRALVKACHDPDPSARVWALAGISACRQRRQESTLFGPALAEVIRLLSDPEPDVRGSAANAIGAFAAQAAPEIPRLIELLDDPVESVRATAAESLGRLDRTDKRSAARLSLMLNDSDDNCQRTAARALEDLGLTPDQAGTVPGASPAQ